MKNVLALCPILGAKCDHLVAVWSPVKDGPLYPMLKDIGKEALRHLSLAFRDLD